MKPHQIKVCYFPGRESSYVRNRVLIKGLREAGHTVFDCSHPKKSFFRYITGFFKFLKYEKEADVIFVGFLGHFLVPLVKLFTKKPIVFDTFLSMYQTLVYDRKTAKPNSLKAKIVKYIESKACLKADINLLDTNEQIKFMLKEYPELKEKKFFRSLLGADDTVMYPRNLDESKEFIVHFHGEFQALHGTQYILEAAKLLPNIKFRMVGEGRELASRIDKAKKEGITNIEFTGIVDFDTLADYIAESSVCLGIFGNTEKTQIVIPFKVYEQLAMEKPIITSDTPAIKELLTHKKDVYLCKAADGQALAQAIQALHDNKNLRHQIAKQALNTFRESCSPQIIAKHIEELVRKEIFHEKS